MTKPLPSYVQEKAVKGRRYYYFVLPKSGSSARKYVPLPDVDDPNFTREWRRLNAMYPRSRKPAHWQDKPSRIYFIATDDGEIKIGRAADPAARLDKLQAGNASVLRLLATKAGGCLEEAEYHRRFAASRILGEWFRATPDILAEIEELQRAALVPTEEEQLIALSEAELTGNGGGTKGVN